MANFGIEIELECLVYTTNKEIIPTIFREKGDDYFLLFNRRVPEIEILKIVHIDGWTIWEKGGR